MGIVPSFNQLNLLICCVSPGSKNQSWSITCDEVPNLHVSDKSLSKAISAFGKKLA